ncbi:MAG TPA: TolC family protein [Verrucomicrobiae bacterium]|jgi:outer membrane protein TolC|nr:TolC family protein [Verrucomicrobiae bacterium]
MKISTIIAVVCSGVLTASAQDNSLPINAASNSVLIFPGFINRLVEEARTNNPALKASDSRARAAALNAEAIRSWEDPTASFGVNVFSAQGFATSENGDLVYGVQQKLPLWGMPDLNRKVASSKISTREAETDFHFQQVRRDLIKALAATALAERVVDVDEQDLTWLKATAQAVEAKYRAGQTDAGDALQLQNEVALRTDELLTDQLELHHGWFALNRLLNREATSAWPLLQLPAVAPTVPYSAKLIALGLTNEPELKILEGEVQQARASAELTRRTRLPDVGLGVQGWQYSGDGGFRQGAFTVSFSLPWLNESKYRKDYERERETQRAAEQDRENQTLIVQEELHHLTVDLDAARRKALLYQNEIAVRARQALADKLAAWETGRVALREVLDAHRDALDAQLMAARSIAAQYQTLADLLLWTGLDGFDALVPLANEPELIPHHANH